MFSRSVVFCFIISYTLYGQGDLEKGIDYYNNRQDGSTKSAAVITPINNAIRSLKLALKKIEGLDPAKEKIELQQ